MCLDTISRKPTKKFGIAYNCARMYQYDSTGIALPIGAKIRIETTDRKDMLDSTEWNVAVKNIVFTVGGKEYSSGFHLWATKSGANAWLFLNEDKIAVFEYRGARVIGTQHRHKVIVADEIKFVKFIERM